MSLDFLKSFGIFPDILMGKKPGQAITDNLKAGAMVGGAMIGGPAALGAMGSMGGAPAAATTPPAGGFMGLLDTAGQYAKPFGDAAGAANQVNGLLSQPQQQPPMVQQGGGPGVGQAMGGILQNQQQLDQQRMAEARKRMGLLGGPYG